MAITTYKRIMMRFTKRDYEQLESLMQHHGENQSQTVRRALAYLHQKTRIIPKKQGATKPVKEKREGLALRQPTSKSKKIKK